MNTTLKGVLVALLVLSLVLFIAIKIGPVKSNLEDFDMDKHVEEVEKQMTKEKAERIIEEMFEKISEDEIKGVIEDVTEKQKGLFVTIGDSITARDTQIYGTDPDNPYIGYQQTIKEELNMAGFINLGVSGATIARGTPYLRGLTKIAMDYNFGDVEFIIVQAGTNDFSLDTPLGDKSELSSEDPDRFNFYGAYTGLLIDLKRNNKDVDIFLFTPTQRDCTNYGEGCTNGLDVPFKDYVEAIKDVGEHFGVEVIDMYDNFKINQNTLFKYIPEGLHPNNDGYKLMGEKFVKDYREIKKLN